MLSGSQRFVDCEISPLIGAALYRQHLAARIQRTTMTDNDFIQMVPGVMLYFDCQDGKKTEWIKVSPTVSCVRLDQYGNQLDPADVVYKFPVSQTEE